MNDSRTASLSGSVERVTFHNEENGYSVLRVAVQGERELVTVIGHSSSVNAGEEIAASGQWVDSHDYGRQFRAEKITTSEPNSEAGIERYLASNLIDGIGPVYAKKLVAKFGGEIFDIIDNYSRRLEEVEGIGRKRRKEIKASWEKQKAIRGIMVFLHEHGISTARAVRIFKTYGEESLAILEANPYRLARDIRGIGFKTADDIAGKLGMPRDALPRLEAGLQYVLLTATDQGHCALPETELLDSADALLSAGSAKLAPALEGLLARGDLTRDPLTYPPLIYLPHLQFAEKSIAARLRAFAGKPADYPAIDIPAALDWCEKKTGKTLADGQRAAVAQALGNRALVITGGPGVGKTTILNSILLILRAKNITPVLAAPTGRAAKRLSESTGLEARTLHRLLEAQPGNSGAKGGFARHDTHPLEGDLFVVDETSMVDVPLMHAFLRALPEKAHLLLVGDVDQLPSVGPGRVLADLIDSALLPVARLTEIFRQAATSRIITTAHAINAGHVPDLELPAGTDSAASDFFFIERDDPGAIAATVAKLIRDRLPARFGLDPLRDIQLLTPMHRGNLGTRAMNDLLQRTLNPPSETKFEVERFGITYRTGDKVLQTRNNYDKDAFNGDIGHIVAIGTDPGRIEVRFDDGRLAEYEPGELDELALAYAITIHKAQGSEFPAVVIPLATQQYLLLQRNLLYTGLTRGKRLVILVGQKKALAMAVRNHDTESRHRALKERLLP
jgi:exodeoxyribonuclease V alpha subunit